tara:strand:+ start:42 stop:413 length:372 start_codon:yes stop_codon:yes gene_type:complete
MSVNDISIEVRKEITEVKTAIITVSDIVRILKQSAEETLDNYSLYEGEVALDADSYGNECTVTLSGNEVSIEDKINDIFDDGEILIEEFLDEQYNAATEQFVEDAKKVAAKKSNVEEGENGTL